MHAPSILRLVLFFLAYASSWSLSTANPLEKRVSRTNPPSGAVVVRQSGATSGQFTTIQAAVNSLPNDGSARVIFIFPGTYAEQVIIPRSGQLTIYGSTTDSTSYTSNSVTITHSESAAQAGSDPPTGTLQVNKDNFALYNVNVKNTFGSGSQALALSASGSNQGYYGCGFYGFQDTLLAESGTQFYAASYIEGAVDFIWGQHGHAFFEDCTIASVAAGTITADGPTSTTDSLFVINKSNIIVSSSASSSLTGQVFLGRPWTQFAQVVYTSCTLGAHINGAGWEIWSTATPNTADVTFAEFASTGAGAAGTRASFSKKLTSNTGFMAANVLGSTWTSWVDTSYVL
ncbi:pectin lyase fold/virulence factor [Roridomyces roridus]|uniref:pectinesterase n=1 Tax=Roridomyces roridus TaxID=1738132 RepID=A0AAD7BET3_9AGAR|nr:pectin lyase fold/virulence factor [Roridomyces roridus]